MIALQLLGGELQRLAILPHRSRDDLLVLLQMLRCNLQEEAVSLHFRQPLLLLGAGLEYGTDPPRHGDARGGEQTARAIKSGLR